MYFSESVYFREENLKMFIKNYYYLHIKYKWNYLLKKGVKRVVSNKKMLVKILQKKKKIIRTAFKYSDTSKTLHSQVK